MARMSRWSPRRVAARGVRPRHAAWAGATGVVIVTLAVAPFGETIGHATQALLLVVPVVATAALGGRRPALVVAALATLMFTLVLPPVGSLRLRFTEDIVALVVFSAVAITIGGLVAYRIEMAGHLEAQRAALLRSVSHDLRTPLAAIQAATSDLADSSLYDEATRARLIELVGEEAERLDRLVADLLSLARIEAGSLHPRRGVVDLGELARQSSQSLARTLDGTPVTVTEDPDLPVVLGDHTLLQQAVTNLIENAARHSPPGAPVEVEARAGHRGVEIAVRDHGPGVPPEDRDAIFEPFRSGGADATRGIGLAICKAVVKAHGGTITVRDAPGGGARFTVSLPHR
jgi:K+-sensing histidine kinase KdpD